MSTEPRATYRVQLHAGFTLDDAAEIVPYLKKLGISHLYCSPVLQAAPGSTHGYDVINHTRVSEDLGGQEALDRLAASLISHQMGIVLDIVPNHMAIIGSKNPWWWDVLENGLSSPYATYFDVDWGPPEARYSNQILVPVLSDQYGRELEAGKIQLVHRKGAFEIRYYDNLLPVDPRSLGSILFSAAERTESDQLAFLAGSYDRLPSPAANDRANARRYNRDKAVLHNMLRRLAEENQKIDAAINQVVADYNHDADTLDALLALQNYRLAFWRITERELGYRRFFDVTSLIGLRMEDEQVYRDTHALILQWLANGLVDGLRVDHPDGLRDPAGYFNRLKDSSPDAWVVIEKILEPGEKLPESWPVAGTTGYDFLYRANHVLVDPEGEKPLTDFYESFSRRETDYPALVRAKKLQVMREVLGSEIGQLTSLFLTVCERHRQFRDYTRGDLRDALTEMAANLPVYRTYANPKTDFIDSRDVTIITEARDASKAQRQDLDPRLLDFLADLLCLRVRGDLEDELVVRFQQFTGPAMAKGVEDTVFYNYYRLVSLNEVGGNPGCFSLSVDEFHRSCEEAVRHWPASMLATTTHDTKRSEDVRARLNVLSEIPEKWINLVRDWSLNNERYRQNGMPDRNDEYLFYQTLVGAWPIDTERISGYMEKACRESKVHTSWTHPDQGYESAVAAFAKAVMQDDRFLQGVEAFVQQIREAGWVNSLSQTLLKLAAPGVPDIYQGAELWAMSLVDPDNRRPVDYDVRLRLLDELDNAPDPETIWSRAEEGLPKLWLIRQALEVREKQADAFGLQGDYTPLEAGGAPDAIAFMRGHQVVMIAPRLVMKRGAVGSDAQISIPGGSWINVLTGERLLGGAVELSNLLLRFPVALLVKEER